ncbi:hypothetical protein GC169_10150 [bacterium]|nr:hypothetical protein [bacterium]
MRNLIVAAAFGAALFAPSALAQDAAGGAKYSIETQTIGELVKNPETKAVLEKHIAELVANPQLEQGYEMKFADIVSFVPDVLTPEVLKAIDADLAALK